MHPDHSSDYIPEEAPDWDALQSHPASSRRRLFAILAWAGAGFAATAALAVLFPFLLTVLLQQPKLFAHADFGWAGGSVTVGLAAFAGICWLALRMNWDDRRPAQILLWSAAMLYAVLINLLAGALDIADSNRDSTWFVEIAAAVLGAGAAALSVLAIAAGIGTGSVLRTLVRWSVIVAVTTVPFILAEPDISWAGVISGLVLAWTADEAILVAERNPYVPEPALAACLVAGVSAVTLLVILIIVRFVMRIFGFLLEFVAAFYTPR